jgi:hypothetical protein
MFLNSGSSFPVPTTPKEATKMHMVENTIKSVMKVIVYVIAEEM